MSDLVHRYCKALDLVPEPHQCAMVGDLAIIDSGMRRLNVHLVVRWRTGWIAPFKQGFSVIENRPILAAWRVK
jgi:hypothetical protein